MCLDAVLSRFVEQSPVTVMTQMLVDRALEPSWVDELFERYRQRQYKRELLFSTTVELMSLVALGLQPSVHAAVQARKGLSVSLAALYDKINRTEPGLARGLVVESARRLEAVAKELRQNQTPLCPGYRVLVLDGSHLPSSEKRLARLRPLQSGPLPGLSLVVYAPDAGIVVDLVPCEDGYSQERALMPHLLQTAKPGDLWLADRNFCTGAIIAGWQRQGASFAVREHTLSPKETPLTALEKVGRVETGWVYEQSVQIAGDGGDSIDLRRIDLRLDQPTEDGETDIYILTNLPRSWDARQVAMLYRKRWSIERMFQWLESVLQSEVRTLGYPRAALFAFSVAVLAFNVLSTIQSAIELQQASALRRKGFHLSLYYVAGEIRASYAGMMIAVPGEAWGCYQALSAEALTTALLQIAAHVELSKFRSHPRGPKKVPHKSGPSGVERPHVSTARILTGKPQGRRS